MESAPAEAGWLAKECAALDLDQQDPGNTGISFGDEVAQTKGVHHEFQVLHLITCVGSAGSV